jgi:hypothetical protein
VICSMLYTSGSWLEAVIDGIGDRDLEDESTGDRDLEDERWYVDGVAGAGMTSRVEAVRRLRWVISLINFSTSLLIYRRHYTSGEGVRFTVVSSYVLCLIGEKAGLFSNTFSGRTCLTYSKRIARC